jgi:type VI secretion system secreted protein VgrG
MSTRNPAKLALVSFGEGRFDVVDFTVHEPMSALFEVVVKATSTEAALDPRAVVGEGAALRFAYHSGDLVWAGICRSVSVTSQEIEDVATNVFTFTIVPALARTTLRRGHRVFQRVTVPQIVGKILGEWKIPHVLDLREEHVEHEFRVQYGETDFAFLSRLLEEEGISYVFDHTPRPGKGSEVSSIIFRDAPHLSEPKAGAFPHRNTGRHKTFEDSENVVFETTVSQRMAFGKTTIRDFDFRALPHAKVVAVATAASRTVSEELHEDYAYQPGAFWALPGPDGGPPTPTADDKGKARTLEPHAKLRAERALGAARHAREVVTFATSALDLVPGDVFAMGQHSSEHHPNPQLGVDRRLLVIERRLHGTALGIEHENVTAVFAESPHRPARVTPLPRVMGLETAIVVGAKDQEIAADELGRVRVRFHWDREHGFDDEASCWMRVSEAAAGSGFGLMHLPRVGQEVIVSFYEGNPETPVIVGRLFGTANGVPYVLPAHQTETGFRSQSSGGDKQSGAARGYNEIELEDATGHERFAIRAERDLSTLVKGGESADVGGSRTTHVGESDSLHLTHGPKKKDDGAPDKPNVLETFVGETTGVRLTSENVITLATSGASIVINVNDIIIDVSASASVHAGKQLQISAAKGGAVYLRGGDTVELEASTAPAPAPKGLPAADGPGGGPMMRPPYVPTGKPAPPPAPGAFDEIDVRQEPRRG